MIIDFGNAQNKTILSTAGEFINPALEIVFESCQAETSRQYNIGLASCEFYRGKKECLMRLHYAYLRLMRYPLGHDCSSLIINLTMRFCFVLCLMTNQKFVQSNAILAVRRGKMS